MVAPSPTVRVIATSWAASAGIATRCENLHAWCRAVFEGCRFAQPLATGYDGSAINLRISLLTLLSTSCPWLPWHTIHLYHTSSFTTTTELAHHPATTRTPLLILQQSGRSYPRAHDLPPSHHDHTLAARASGGAFGHRSGPFAIIRREQPHSQNPLEQRPSHARKRVHVFLQHSHLRCVCGLLFRPSGDESRTDTSIYRFHHPAHHRRQHCMVLRWHHV